ncbi:MAG: hypothetical protein LQ349_001049 [Xanthoria aureola]|nr:MAG: hypothetical protein LQ349_001049 [Xanthoria aureola]
MSSFEDHLDRMGKLENLLKQVQTIAARGDNYGPAMKVLELWLPDVASEKIISERARDIERDLMKRKESLTAQKAECDKREAAIASREAKIAERESTLDVQVNDILPAEMRKLQLATDRIEDSAASFADSTRGTASNLADSTRDTASNIAELKAAVESMKDEQATQRQQHDVLERRYAEKERLLAEQEQRHLERERRLAEAEQRHAKAERRLAETEQRHAKSEQGHAEAERRLAEAEQRHAKAEQRDAEKEKRLLEKEQSLSRVRDALSEQSMEQQRILQEQNATFHAQWSDLSAERKTMVEIRRNAKLYVEEYISRHNQVTKSIDENVVGVQELRAQIEEAKVQVARNRENHADALVEARDVDDVLQVTVARLASCRRDRQSLMMQWAESSTIFQEASTLPSRQPQFTEMQQHGHGEPSPRRKRTLPISSTDTSPQKPAESKRARSESMSPRHTRQISPVFGRGHHAPAQAALEGSRLPLSSGSIHGRPQGASRRPGLFELGVQSPEVGPVQQGKETSATSSAAGASASPLNIPEAGQGLWSQLTLNIEPKARKVLADLLFKKPSKTAKGKASQRPIPLLTRGANSKTPMCLTSLLKAINPSNFGARDGREACDNCKATHPCLRVSWKNIGGAEADDDSKEWRIEKRPPRP